MFAWLLNIALFNPDLFAVLWPDFDLLLAGVNTFPLLAVACITGAPKTF
jgi:hypothetical protein